MDTSDRTKDVHEDDKKQEHYPMHTRPTTLIQANFEETDDHLSNAEVENLEFVTPTSVFVVPVLMENSAVSNASTNNTDICILETHESHYAMETHLKSFNQQLNDSSSIIDAPDFTVLNAPTPSPAAPPTYETTTAAMTPPPLASNAYQKRHSDSCACDESTEVLLLHSVECNGKSTHLGGSNGHAFSGTDSDVEVLMSEEILDSDWSAGAGTLDDCVRTPPEEEALMNRGNFTNSAQMITAAQNNSNTHQLGKRSGSSASVKPQESTDQDISVEEFSQSSVSACEQLPRSQLLSVIREQAVHIRHLEATVQRYRKAQSTLFEHVEALRLALETESDSEVAAVRDTEQT